VVGDSSAFDDVDLDVRMSLRDHARETFHQDIPAAAGPAGHSTETYRG
jgi:hypothetical protein